jgi:G patch domain-containing protein 1
VQDGVAKKRNRGFFHGAFEGGFSAGYFNSVGSAQGWEPGQFVSSRGARQTQSSQRVEDFLDEDELQEYNKTVLRTSTAYDTFGGAAKEDVNRSVSALQGASNVPMLVPDVMLTPVSEGMGVKLLLRMGWRQGRSITQSAQEMKQLVQGVMRLEDLEKVFESKFNSKKKSLSVSSSFRLQALKRNIEPKLDTFGLGYDPFEGAEEFRKPSKTKSGQAPKGRGIAFGTGVLMDGDDAGILDDYVTHDGQDMYGGGLDMLGRPRVRHQGLLKDKLGDRLAQEGYSYEVQDVGDEDGVFRNMIGETPMPMLSDVPMTHREHTVKGFIPATSGSVGDILPAVYPRPKIDKSYVPRTPAALQEKSSLIPAWGQKWLDMPKHVPGDTLKRRIDQVALQVARSGPAFERLIDLKDKEDTFIKPGDVNHPYYVWSVQRFYRKIHPNVDQAIRKQRLDSAQRGMILGEEQLEPARQPVARAPLMGGTIPSLQDALKQIPEEQRKRIEERMAKVFVKGESVTENQYLLKPGLTSGKGVDASVGESSAKDSTRDAHTPGKIVTVMDLSKPIESTVCASSKNKEGIFEASRAGIPIRTVEEWTPEPLLCKRLGIENYSARKSIPSSDRPAARMEDTHHFPFDDLKKEEEFEDATVAAEAFLDSLIQVADDNSLKSNPSEEENLEPQEKPVDLFQAIFEDSSESDEDESGRDNIVSEFKPTILEPQETHSGKDYGFQKFQRHLDEGTRRSGSKRHSPDESHEMKDHMSVDDQRIRDALRIVREDEERKRRRRKEKKRHRSRLEKKRHDRK